MPDLGKAYVSIIPKAEGISDQISNIITPATTSAGQTGGARLSQGIARGINTAGGIITKFAATGAATIAGMGATISARAFGGGLSRAMQIDDARAKMTQLGMATEKIMSNVNDSVTGTRYGLNEMAGIAVNFASSGVKAGKDMTGALKSVASVASISGTDLNHMGAIFNKVSSAGHVTGQVMTQLSYNGINASAALQKHFGKSSEEISKMVSQGKIGFKDFSDAMYKYFGDASLSANSTFSGAMANVGAALSRIGAKFADPALSKLREIFAGTNAEVKGGLILALDNLSNALQPVIDKFAVFVNEVGSKVLTAIEAFNTAMANGASVSEAFKSAIAELIPQSLIDKFNELSPGMQSVVLHLGKAAAVVGGVAGGMGLLSGAVASLVPGLGMLLGPLGGSAGAFGLVSKAGSMLFNTISSLIGGTGGLSGALSVLTGPVGIVGAAIAGLFVCSEDFRKSVMGLVQSVGSALMPIIQSLLKVVQPLVSLIMKIAGAVGDLLAPVINVLSAGLTKLLNVLAPVIDFCANKVAAAFEGMATIVESVTTVIKEKASKAWDAIKTKTKSAWDGVKSHVSSAMSKVSSVTSKAWSGIKSKSSGAVSAIKAYFKSMGSVVGISSSTFDKVKEKISKPVEKARDLIKKAIDKIKSFFKFTADTPKIKLPHFSISPAGWKIKDLLKGSIPKLSISWAAQGGIMNTPTLVGAGEAGKEALLPLDPFWERLDSMADSMGKQEVVMYNTFNITGADDPEQVVATVASKLKYAMRTA